MDNKVCFLFGHATAPYEIVSLIEQAAEKHYREYGVRTFIVGSRGSFDSYAATAVKSLKRRYGDISLMLLLSYHPAERPVDQDNMQLSGQIDIWLIQPTRLSAMSNI